ncbi:DUF6452 family protein [Winogradskyella forsetii]|uniref:DUF6452 family protein n=1 Tax=Winogradskyella forsetii TaxID=2686077 RepID=UPI0015B8CB8E|nr:DUF6452 family protein [Winogradskyella forsetii]
MKRLLIFISFITLAILSFNCERDDICAETTSTTPRLIVEFYDIDDLEVLKNVPRLTVYGDGVLELDEEGNPIEPTVQSDTLVAKYNDDDSYVFNVNTNTLALPLLIEEESTDNSANTITIRYILEKDTNLRVEDDDLTTNSNKDILVISYSTEFVYVSRACGYKSIFTELNVTSESNDSEPWIANIIIEESIENTVENENTTHVRIYH